MNRRSVAKGLAIGLAAAFIVPLGQFLLAALVSIPVRANVAVTVTVTLITNPITVPPIYFVAFKVGQAAIGSWSPGLLHPSSKLLGVAGPTALGLFIFAVVFSLLGFAAARLWFRLKLMRRWRRRSGAVS